MFSRWSAWWLWGGGGLIATSSKRTMPHNLPSRSAAARPPVPTAGHCWPVPPQETLIYSKTGLTKTHGVHCSFPWVLVHISSYHLFCLHPPSVSDLYEIYFKSDFAPSTILFRFLLCPWSQGTVFWWYPTFPYRWFFSSLLCFLCSPEDELMSFYSGILTKKIKIGRYIINEL